MSKVAYVVGFAIADDNRVVLIRKEKPAWQKDKWNGVGGKVEGFETPEQAMAREFLEETGCDVPAGEWKHFATWDFIGEDAVVHVLAARVEVDLPIQTMTNELVAWEHLNLRGIPVIPNLHWAVRLARYAIDEAPFFAHFSFGTKA